MGCVHDRVRYLAILVIFTYVSVRIVSTTRMQVENTCGGQTLRLDFTISRVPQNRFSPKRSYGNMLSNTFHLFLHENSPSRQCNKSYSTVYIVSRAFPEIDFHENETCTKKSYRALLYHTSI